MARQPEAIQTYDQAIAVDPGFTNPWISKGSVWQVSRGHCPLWKVKEMDMMGNLDNEVEKSWHLLLRRCL